MQPESDVDMPGQLDSTSTPAESAPTSATQHERAYNHGDDTWTGDTYNMQPYPHFMLAECFVQIDGEEHVTQ